MLKTLFRYSENDNLIFSNVASVKALRSLASRTVRESFTISCMKKKNKKIYLHNVFRSVDAENPI